MVEIFKTLNKKVNFKERDKNKKRTIVELAKTKEIISRLGITRYGESTYISDFINNLKFIYCK